MVCMRPVVFESIKVLVALPTALAAIRFLLFHAHIARIRGSSFRVDNRESAIAVLRESLIDVSVL